MKLSKRAVSIILMICVLGGVLYYAFVGKSASSSSDENSVFLTEKTRIKLWYNDDSLTDYLDTVVSKYNDSHSDSRLEIKLVSGLEYLENIGQASVNGDDFPDLYIITNDFLEKAQLAGLAANVDESGSFLLNSIYPDASLSAVSSGGSSVAFPYYYETSALMYNKTYLKECAKNSLEAEIDTAAGEAAMDSIEDSGDMLSDASDSSAESISYDISDEDISNKMNEMLPVSIADIISFAENYDAPSDVEAVFKWDVSDIFYNFFFVGNYMNLGGNSGDDVSQIDIYNENTISCMNIYQELNQFFAIDSDESSYDSTLQDFIDGKILFTVATTDALSKIKEAKAEGNCSFEYGVTDIPDINDQFQTRTMSVTSCIAVNGYSDNQVKAENVAEYLCSQPADEMYLMTGKNSVRSDALYSDENDNQQAFWKAYSKSVPMPKMLETSNLWLELEIAFTQIWNGADSNETLRALSEKITTQVTGETYSQEAIPNTENVSILSSEEN